MKLNIKKNYYLLFIIFSCFFLIFFFLPSSYAATAAPKAVKTIQNAFESIEKWLLAIATPAAAVATITGLFIQKFSFGDEERIRTGKKLVRSSLFCYAFVLGIDLILAAIKVLIK